MKKTSDLSGIAAMVAATAAFVVSDSFMKLVFSALPPYEVLGLRGAAASLACAIVLAIRREWHFIPEALSSRALLRAAGETLSTLCYILALSQMQIADVIAMVQVAPLMLTLGAAIFFRERIGPARLVLVLLGFTGALMVAQPTTSGVSPGMLLALGCAVLIVVRDLVGRNVPTRIPVTVVIFTTMLMIMGVGGVLSFGFESWVVPTGEHVVFLGASGLFVMLGHIGLLLAYRLGRTSVIAPFFYCLALWGVVSGLVIWRELPNPLALAGITLIVLSGVAIVVLNKQQDERKVVPAIPN